MIVSTPIVVWARSHCGFAKNRYMVNAIIVELNPKITMDLTSGSQVWLAVSKIDLSDSTCGVAAVSQLVRTNVAATIISIAAWFAIRPCQ